MASEFLHVIKLTDETFHPFINKHDLVLVVFAFPATRVPRVQALSIVYEQAATILQDAADVKLAWVDLTAEKKISNQFPVSYIPTITLFNASKPIGLYVGAWISSELVLYARRQLLPVLSPVTATSLLALKEAVKVLIVGCFDNSDTDTIKAFKRVANTHHREHVFSLCTDGSLANCPGITLYANFDDGNQFFRYNGQTDDEDAIWSFITSASTPLIIDIRPELHKNLIKAALPLGYIFLGSHSPEERSQLVSLVQPLAVQYKDRIQFAFINAHDFLDSVEDMHLDGSPNARWPTFAIKDSAKGHRYLFDRQAQSMPTQQKLSEYLKAFFDGDLERDIKSEPLPVEPQLEAVQTIVGLTFDALVLDETKDVFVDYYTQSCSPCKAMATQWEKLAQIFKDNKEGRQKVLIGKMDAEANDVSEDIRGYPWLLLYPSGRKDRPVQYVGNRTVQDMALFVREHGTHGVDVAKDLLLINN